MTSSVIIWRTTLGRQRFSCAPTACSRFSCCSRPEAASPVASSPTQLEVSARTVHRDLEALGAAGVPVVALRGSRGGWELSEGWRTQVPGLDDAELRALLMAQPRVIGDRPLAAAAERALAKLMAAMPEAQRQRAASMRQRLYVDPTGWRGTTENLAMLPVVQDAVTHDRKLSMRYRSAGKSPESAWSRRWAWWPRR